MDLTCKKCGHHYDGAIDRKKGKWYSVCPTCGKKWQVEVPKGRITMAFTDAVDDEENPYRYFNDDFTGEHIVAYYAFDTPSEFIKKWEEIHEQPNGMWYWVLDNAHCICSGACDPNDIDVFREHWYKVLVRPPQYITERTLEYARDYVKAGIARAMTIKSSVHAVFLSETLILRKEQTQRYSAENAQADDVVVTYKFVPNWAEKTAEEINVCLAESKWLPTSDEQKRYKIALVGYVYEVQRYSMMNFDGIMARDWKTIASFSSKADAIYHAEVNCFYAH